MSASRPGALPSLSVELVPIDELRPDPANPRRISEDELDALERSIRQFGFVAPVVARREDRTVIGGHQRLVAARRLGLTSVPVIWLDIGVEQARLLGLTLNKISGTWDEALLARLLAELGSVPDWSDVPAMNAHLRRLWTVVTLDHEMRPTVEWGIPDYMYDEDAAIAFDAKVAAEPHSPEEAAWMAAHNGLPF